MGLQNKTATFGSRSCTKKGHIGTSTMQRRKKKHINRMFNKNYKPVYMGSRRKYKVFLYVNAANKKVSSNGTELASMRDQ